MYRTAQEYAHVSYRTDPNAYDVIAACEEAGVDIYGLKKLAYRKRKPTSSSEHSALSYVSGES